jgi:hypothetical protein
MSVVEFPQTPSWLAKYYDRGFRLIFYGTKKKGPEGQEALKWTERSDEAKDWRTGRNVGVFTGHEISDGKYLVDVDFDWSDGLPLAKRIMPATGFGFGRASRTISHSFYTSPKPIASRAYDNIDGKPFVELRGTKTDGTIGLQTMLPPSIHPSGEEVKLLMDEEIGHYEDIERHVTLYAVACMIFAHLGHRGAVHDNRMAIAGFLLSEGLSPAEVLLVGSAIVEACGNNVADFELIHKTTIARYKANEPVQGRGALIKAFGDDGKKIVARIKEWLGGSDFQEDSKGRINANNQDNVKLALEKLELGLSFDLFAQKPLVDYPGNGNGSAYRGPLVDAIVRYCWLEVDNRFKFRPSKDFFYDVVENVAHSRKFHPVLDYLRNLEWDGIPRVNEWLIRAGGAGDTEYTKAVSAIMLIAAVRRVTQPGCKYDEMVVLESGKQGLMKSTALRTLCPNEAWFSDDLPLNVDAKQIVERTLGKWIIEASDLSGMQSSQVEHLKGMLSRQVDGPVRLAYGRLPVEQPRQFIIVGTTNSYTYLTDSTGNRRFWPIRIKGFDISWIKENRDQLWAEAYVRERAGESIRLDPALYGHATLQQERRRAEDPWELKLGEVFSREEKHRLAPDDVWGALGLSIDRQDPKAHDRVLKAMHRLGFTRKTVRTTDGKVVKGFSRDPEEGQMSFEE